jgi:dienelactone hydrolase
MSEPSIRREIQSGGEEVIRPPSRAAERLRTRRHGAPHAFHADYRPSYRKEAAEDGWKRMLDRFRRHGAA